MQGSFNLLAAGATNSSAITVGLDTSTAGNKTGDVGVVLVSDGTGIDDFGKTSLGTAYGFVTGAVYRYAAASISPLSLPPIVHVGDSVDLTVANAATADGYSENLDVSILSSPTGASASGAIGGLAAGSSSSAISLTFDTAGNVSGNLVVDSQSDGGTGAGSIDGLGTTDLGATSIGVDTTVNNYAVAQFEELSGGGTWSQDGTIYTLDLGRVAQGSSPISIDLGILNAVLGPSDLLAGSFETSASGAFALAGFGDFSGLGAGQADTAPKIAFSTGTTGTFTETITLDATGSNASGYSGVLSPETLTITGTVIAQNWVGPNAKDRSGNFDTAADWNTGIVPNSATKTTISNTGTYTVTSGQSNSVASLTLKDAGATLAITGGTFSILGSSSNAGKISVGDGSRLQVTSNVTNNGTIALNGTGDATSLVIAGSATLYGAGEVTLADAAGNSIVSNGAAATLTNHATISGSGTIGDANLTLINGTNGIIDATGTAAGLTISGAGTFKNQGKVEATGSAGLTIEGAVYNTGTLAAAPGDLTVTGELTGTGKATIADNATLTLDARVGAAQTVMFTGATGTLALALGQDFAGTVAGLADGDVIDLKNFAYSTSTKKLSITGVTTSGGDTIVTIKDGGLVATIALYGEFGTSAGDYTLSSDHRAGTAGTLFQLAAAQV